MAFLPHFFSLLPLYLFSSFFFTVSAILLFATLEASAKTKRIPSRNKETSLGAKRLDPFASLSVIFLAIQPCLFLFLSFLSDGKSCIGIRKRTFSRLYVLSNTYNFKGQYSGACNYYTYILQFALRSTRVRLTVNLKIKQCFPNCRSMQSAAVRSFK